MLGIALVNGPSSPTTLLHLKAHTGQSVEGNPALEAYQVFWRDRSQVTSSSPPGDATCQPSMGLSAADLAAVAACVCSLIAPHLVDGATGSHLFASAPSLKPTGVLIEPVRASLPQRKLEQLGGSRSNSPGTFIRHPRGKT
jgi:hypothetical protein